MEVTDRTAGGLITMERGGTVRGIRAVQRMVGFKVDGWDSLGTRVDRRGVGYY